LTDRLSPDPAAAAGPAIARRVELNAGVAQDGKHRALGWHVEARSILAKADGEGVALARLDCSRTGEALNMDMHRITIKRRLDEGINDPGGAAAVLRTRLSVSAQTARAS
jgi:hypothetical protein